MQMLNVLAKPYALLASGILIVEPHPGLLAARALLLGAADDYVAIVDRQIQGRKHPGLKVNVAVLSQSLGNLPLTSLAQQIRTRWPSAQILIVGDVTADLNEQLYDTAIREQCRPEELLEALYHLSQGLERSRRAMSQGVLLITSSKRGNHVRAISESDPRKTLESGAGGLPRSRDLPAGEPSFGF